MSKKKNKYKYYVMYIFDGGAGCCYIQDQPKHLTETIIETWRMWLKEETEDEDVVIHFIKRLGKDG